MREGAGVCDRVRRHCSWVSSDKDNLLALEKVKDKDNIVMLEIC